MLTLDLTHHSTNKQVTLQDPFYVPVINKEGKVIGCTQVLNKSGGKFTDEDESQIKSVHPTSCNCS